MAQSPEFLPVLRRGRHRSPVRGACFMEYTALLAGEAFTDAPDCVDGELAAVLRHANDRLGDRDRFRLVPLLGRAVGLRIAPPPAFRQPRRRGLRRSRAAAADPGAQDALARHEAALADLRRSVARRFTAALGVRPSAGEWRAYAGGRDVDRLFWFLMGEPAPVSTSAAYVDRLVERLELLHACYEQALAEAGPARPSSSRCPSADALPDGPSPASSARTASRVSASAGDRSGR